MEEFFVEAKSILEYIFASDENNEIIKSINKSLFANKSIVFPVGEDVIRYLMQSVEYSSKEQYEESFDEIVSRIVHASCGQKVEDAILNNSIATILEFALEYMQLNKHQYDHLHDALKIIEMFSTREISIKSRSYIASSIVDSEQHLVSSALYLLMTGISHHQNNLFLGVHSQFNMLYNIAIGNIKSESHKDKIVNAVESGDTMGQYSDFLAFVSDLYCSYDSTSHKERSLSASTP